MKCPQLLIVFLAVLLTGGVASAQSDLPDVYASNIEYIGESDVVSEIGVMDLDWNESRLLFRNDSSVDDYEVAFEDIVVGPGCSDGSSACSTYVYACDPTSGLIIRFDPAQVDGTIGINSEEVEIVYQAGVVDGGSGNILNPQCGWFTNQGALIFTSQNNKGAWICEGIGFEIPGAAGTFADPRARSAPKPWTISRLSSTSTFRVPASPRQPTAMPWPSTPTRRAGSSGSRSMGPAVCFRTSCRRPFQATTGPCY